MVRETDSWQHASEVLKAEGFDVQTVPRGPTKTADFLVSDAEHKYLVEVTGKEEDGFLCDLAHRAGREGLATGTRYPSPNNTLDSIVRKKAKQLAETPVKADFQVLWIAAFHRDWEYLWGLLMRTLYGAAKLHGCRSMRDPPTFHTCLYYHHFSFYKTKNLDAVVFSTADRGALFVNDLTKSAERFRGSQLYRRFKEPVDPGRSRVGLLIVDPDIERSADARREYLQDRYGLMTAEMITAEWGGVCTLPR